MRCPRCPEAPARAAGSARVAVHLASFAGGAPASGSFALRAGGLPRRPAELATLRAWLVGLLAGHLGRAPDGVVLARSAEGKPALASGELELSLSYAAGIAAAAVCREAPVGIDVEWIRPVPEALDVAAEWLPAEALEAVLRAPRGQRDRELTGWWTRLEAAVKACGAGLTRGGPSCLDHVACATCEPIPGLVLSVAALLAPGGSPSRRALDGA